MKPSIKSIAFYMIILSLNVVAWMFGYQEGRDSAARSAAKVMPSCPRLAISQFSIKDGQFCQYAIAPKRAKWRTEKL